MKHILIADDHELFRDSLRVWIERSDSAFRIDTVGSFGDVDRALRRRDSYDILLLDLDMPGMQGVVSVRDLCERTGTTRVIVVSAEENPATIRACLDCGAAGYVPKSASGETIMRSILRVMNGETFVPHKLIERDISAAPDFTDSQLDILALLAVGATNKQIASRMSLTEGTVKQYVSTILSKLHVDNRTQAGMAARELLHLGNA